MPLYCRYSKIRINGERYPMVDLQKRDQKKSKEYLYERDSVGEKTAGLGQ